MGVLFYAGWFVLVIAIACAVLLVAAAVSSDRPGAGRGLGGFLQDVRAGWRGLAERARGRRAGEDVEDDPEPVQVSVDAFFAAAEDEGSAYVAPGELVEGLELAREAVVRGGQAVRDRVPFGHDTVPAIEPAVAAATQPPRRSGHTPSAR